jgi:beta propeller repeat protein
MQYLLLCLVLFSFAVSDAAAQGAQGTEIQIADNEADQYLRAIYGERIVWADDRYVNLPDNIENMTIQDIFKLDTDIFIYNISTGEEFYTLAESFQINPAIYGDIVVWEDYSNAGMPEGAENMTPTRPEQPAPPDGNAGMPEY